MIMGASKAVALKGIGDYYKGAHIHRVNERSRAGKPSVVVKYMILFNGAELYFKTQADVKRFVDVTEDIFR